MASRGKSTPSTLEPGEVLLGRYVVDCQVAEGGMAAIHRTHDNATGETVAVKVLYPYYSQNPVVCTRFLDEGRIQRYLDHPNIINVYDIVEQPQLAIVMEYIDGPTLDEYLTDHGPVNAQELLSLMLPVLSAIGFAHHKGVIHRDIKPSNILLDPTPSGMVPKIMDFGVAKVERGGQDLTAAGTTVGTLHYMSPEQIVGSRDIDGRADIYSLGVTIYKLCTGDVPFNASTEFALMMAQVEARPTPPSDLRPDIDPRLEEIILKALAKKPDRRFQTVKELTSALLELERRGDAYDETDTDTAPLPAELLEYAMMDDEVAIDRTGELDMTQFEALLQNAETLQDREAPPIEMPGEPTDETIQLDADQIRAQLFGDKTDTLTGSGDDEDLVATLEQSAVKRPADSQERTQPLKKPEEDTVEANPPLASDTSSDSQSLSQEITHPFHSDETDRRPDNSSSEVDTQEVTARRTLKDDPQESSALNLPRPAPLRTRASGPDSLTKRSRDELEEEFARIAKEEGGSPSRLQLVLLGLGLLLIVGLTIAIGWVLLDGR